MPAELQNEIFEWMRRDDDLNSTIKDVKAKIDQLENILYDTYIPSINPSNPRFRVRLANWVLSADNQEERKALFLMFEDLMFVGRKEMEACYSSAFSRCVKPWLLGQDNISIFDTCLSAKFVNSVNDTLFTGITESFNVRDFLLQNGIGQHPYANHPHRFVWSQGLNGFDKNRFLGNEMRGKKRIVLLEDFVGSGNQMESAVVQACQLSDQIEVLLVPLIICPKGHERGEFFATQFRNLTYSPVLPLNEGSFISETKLIGENDRFDLYRKVILNNQTKVEGTDGSWPQKTGPYGYRSTGAIIVKFDNCPDNTLPIIHHSSDLGWKAVFDRSYRD